MTNHNPCLDLAFTRDEAVRKKLMDALTGLMLIKDHFDKCSSGNSSFATFPYLAGDAAVELSSKAAAYKTVLDVCGFENLKNWIAKTQDDATNNSDSMKMLKSVYVGLRATEQLLTNGLELDWTAAPGELMREQSEIYVKARAEAFNYALEMCNYSTFCTFLESVMTETPAAANSGVKVALRLVQTEWGPRYEVLRKSGYRAGFLICHGMTNIPIRFGSTEEGVAWLDEIGYTLEVPTGPN